MIPLTLQERSELLRLLAPELRQLNRVPQHARWDLLDRMLAVMPTPSRERVQAREMISPLTLEVLRGALRGDPQLRDDFPAEPQQQARRFVAWANGPTVGELSCQTVVERVRATQLKSDGRDDESVELLLFSRFVSALAQTRTQTLWYREVTFVVFVTAVDQALTTAKRKNAQALEWPLTIGDLARDHALAKPDKHVAALRLLEEVIKLQEHFTQTPRHRNDPQRWQRLAAMAVHAGLLATPLPWGQDEAWDGLPESSPDQYEGVSPY